MIVIGVDVHKHSLSAVAVDEVGRQLDALETTDGEELLSWSKRLGHRKLWALEDCRHVTRGLEQALLAADERLVGVPPRLTAPERRRGRVRGKSDLIDALAVARAALREPVLDSPRTEEARLRELKLLVDHRDDLVDERRRAQQRLRWHLHELAGPRGPCISDSSPAPRWKTRPATSPSTSSAPQSTYFVSPTAATW
jgi:transposase